jgi:hypothetical protein
VNQKTGFVLSLKPTPSNCGSLGVEATDFSHTLTIKNYGNIKPNTDCQNWKQMEKHGYLKSMVCKTPVFTSSFSVGILHCSCVHIDNRQ